MPTSNFQPVSQSDCLILILNINSHIKGQTAQIQKPTDLDYTVCKGRVYLSSAGLGFKEEYKQKDRKSHLRIASGSFV